MSDLRFENQKIIEVDIEREMKKSYIDYAMSVIVGRALPDVRDGLKPVHRRILYTMYEAGLTPEKSYRKSATTVGDVLGKYHPHGDAAVYDTMVRMAQDFSLRYPLVDGHGNFGSIDGDPPAAYRYTEARLAKISMLMLSDIEKNTVTYTPNFDGEHDEPTVLPSRFPNLLVNGSEGIAVGMATKIPPHNLGEVIDATIYLIDNPNSEILDLLDYIKGPDFPTAGTIMGQSGIRSAYLTGRGHLKVRGKAEIEEMGNRFKIVITEIPYLVNKQKMVEAIAELVKEKKIEGISDLRDESSLEGMRVVVELKRDANPQVVLNQLYNYTQLQDSFSIILLALHNNQPKIMNLKEILAHYVAHQKEVIVKRTQFDLKKCEDAAHIREGLLVAVDNIDEVVRIIRASASVSDAKEALMNRFNASAVANMLERAGAFETSQIFETGLTEAQANAIVQMRLGQLTGLEREKILSELSELIEKIKELREILASDARIFEIIKDELTEIKNKYADERRTSIEMVEDDMDIEDLIKQEDCVYTLTHFGYIKRLPTTTYKAQRRGGKGVLGMNTREEDFVKTLFVASTHDYILFFTTRGRMYRLKGYRIPEAQRTAKGMNIVNLLQLEPDEKVTAMIPVHEFINDEYLFMVTRMGTVKRIELSEIDSARKAGVRALSIDEGDELIEVLKTDGSRNIIIATKHGMAVHFKESDVRKMGRLAYGVRGISLKAEDSVIGAAAVDINSSLLTVSENGYGKRTKASEYRITKRGTKGITNYKITEKTGLVAGVMSVTDNDDLMLITDAGIIIRINLDTVNEYSRATQGVKIMTTKDDVRVISIAITEKEEEEKDEQEVEGETTSQDLAE